MPWRVWLCGVLLITFAVYLPTLGNGFTNWDDNKYVTENSTLAHPTLRSVLVTPLDGNYHPLTVLSLVVNYQISQLHPASYHWFNLLLHLGNTALTFLFVQALAGGLWAPVVTSLFFGIHPMHVESVAWIAERKDVLYAFFYLAGLLAYLRYLDTKHSKWYVATLIAFLLSIASKSAAVTFPLTLLAIDWYRRRPFRWAILLEKAPYFAIAIVLGLLTLHAQKVAGAIADAHPWAPFQRILIASYGTVMYIVKVAFPFGLSVIYPYPRRLVDHLGAQFYVALAALLVVLPVGLLLFRRSRAVLFGVMFFFINIVLVLQFFKVGHALMADRYTYLPYIGLFFALSHWMDTGPRPSSSGSFVKTLVASGLLLLVPVCLVQTWNRCRVWQNSESLWSDTIQKYPHRVFDAYFLRGSYYHHTVGRADAALADYDDALKLNPEAPYVLANKGTLFFDLNRMDSAYVYLNHALALKPDIAFALNNRGSLKGLSGDLPGAVTDFTRAIASDPGFREPYENRAIAYYKLGAYERAIADSRRALELDPANRENHALLDAIGQYYQSLHRYRDAVSAYSQAIRTAPYGDPRIANYYFNRSLAWSALGYRSAALKDAQVVQSLGGTLPQPYLRDLGAPDSTVPAH